MMILRSPLFIPGNNLRMMSRAATLPADALIFDLEDAVPWPDKETARLIIRDAIPALRSRGAHLLVRVNGRETGLMEEDIRYVVVEGLDGLVLPKAERKSDMAALDGLLEEAEQKKELKPGSVNVIPLIETAQGVVHAYEIASASKRVVALAFGAGDYCRDLGRDVSSFSPEQTELLYPRAKIVNDSRAAGVQAIDTPFFGLLTDREGFIRETTLVLQFGFKGKLLIHPTQIEFANKTFIPSQEEVGYAQRLIRAFEEAHERGLGAISFEGRMIDYMSYKQAQELLGVVELIKEKDTKRQKIPPLSLFQFFANRSMKKP